MEAKDRLAKDKYADDGDNVKELDQMMVDSLMPIVDGKKVATELDRRFVQVFAWKKAPRAVLFFPNEETPPHAALTWVSRGLIKGPPLRG